MGLLLQHASGERAINIDALLRQVLVAQHAIDAFEAMAHRGLASHRFAHPHQAKPIALCRIGHQAQTMPPFRVYRWAFAGQKILYDCLCMHGLCLLFAVWSLRMKGLTQPCMHRF
ncbi:hypothetical protein NHH82_13150 [Oxalobacteraceae bacterium OTU3REALA1]|nr:hypothetical protein NHH82_13150 [Oxalobacteraceae bacterium OTU3REALA1]